MKTINWKIEGMQCGACARTIEARLVREPGVMQVEVAYPAGTARIFVDAQVADLNQVVALLEQAGYRIETQQSC
ncbi:cation transporter [Pseudomonas sp. R5(2019)]|nr:cation transporter [Pseudomonas sp. R5(2019)]